MADYWGKRRAARAFLLLLPLVLLSIEMLLAPVFPEQLPDISWLSMTLPPSLLMLLSALLVTLRRQWSPFADVLTLLAVVMTSLALVGQNLDPARASLGLPNYLGPAYLAAVFLLAGIPFHRALMLLLLVFPVQIYLQLRVLPAAEAGVTELLSQTLIFFVGMLGGHMLEHSQRHAWLGLKMLEATSRTDPLTGTFNRRGFDESLQTLARLCAREHRPIALILIDLDHFKLLNDHYGHEYGDSCLRAVGQLLRQFARRPLDQAARMGGEEFALTLYNCPQDVLEQRCELLRRDIELLNIEHARSPVAPCVTVSIGAICLLPEQPEEVRDLLRKADERLYRAKQNGRNQVCCPA